MSHAQRIASLIRLQRAQARLDAERVRLLAAIELDRPALTAGELDKHWDREEVACVLRVAGVTAGIRMRESAELVTRYPATLTLLETGSITVWHALRLVEAGIARDDTVMARVEKRVLPRAGEQTIGEFKAAVTRALATLDPQHAQRQHATAREERRVVFSPRPDGTTDLWAPGLSTPDAVAMAEQLRDLARRWKGLDHRTADQRESDALAVLVLGTGQADGIPTVKPAVNVIVAMSTLARARPAARRCERLAPARRSCPRPGVRPERHLAPAAHRSGRPARRRHR